jgi:hypothetical protein
LIYVKRKKGKELNASSIDVSKIKRHLIYNPGPKRGYRDSKKIGPKAQKRGRGFCRGRQGAAYSKHLFGGEREVEKKRKNYFFILVAIEMPLIHIRVTPLPLLVEIYF